MTGQPIATLGGVNLLGLNPVKWATRIGVAPVMESFDIMNDPWHDDHEKLIPDAFAEHTLIINDQSGGREHKFEKLNVIKREPGPTPFISRIVVADQRWKWPYVHILRRYNMRRRTGIGRRVNWTDRELEHTQRLRQDDFAFAPYSLKGRRNLWTAKEIIEDLVERVRSDLFFRLIMTDTNTQVPIENLEIDDTGDNAIARALSYIPGAEIVIDPDGSLRVFLRQPAAAREDRWRLGFDTPEVEVVGKGEIGTPIEDRKAGPEIIGGGGIEQISFHALRPKAIDVLFTIEAEIRLDFNSDPDATVTPGPARIIENVIQVPDFELTIHPDDARALGTSTVAQGTWLTFDQALRAWGQGTGLLSKVMRNPSEAYTFIRRAWIPRMGLWASMGLAGKLDLQGKDSEWGGRISALQTHYRQSFRIDRQLKDNILSLAPYLVATIDPISGQRAPAMAFADHAIRNSQKAIWLSSKERIIGPIYATNVDGYPGKTNPIGPKDKPAPAVVQIVDQDQGIIRLQYQPDPYGMGDMVFPSKLDNVPTMDKKKSSKSPIAFNAASSNQQVPTLAFNQDVALLLTAVPAAPNSNKQLYKIRIEPPAWAGRCSGPIQEVRVGAGVETARIAWHESISDTVEDLFGIGYRSMSQPDLRSFCINDSPGGKSGSGGMKGASSLTDIATAIAHSIWIANLERVQGSMSCRMDSRLPVQGSISEISHTLRSNGAAISTITLPDSLKPIDLMALMPSSTRSKLMRLVQPQ